MKLRNSLLARSAVVLTVVGFTPLPVMAATNSSGAAVVASAESGQSGRTAQRRRAETSEQQAGPRTGPEVMAEAQAVVTSTQTACVPTNAVSPGRMGEINIYEVACESGVGYLLSDGEQPTSRNCYIVAESAERAREANPENQELTCQLPENQNPETLIQRYVQQAGITCEVDESTWIGRSSSGEDRYEIGCSGAEGYWIRVGRDGGYLDRLECAEVAAAGAECRFTTEAERLGDYGRRFASVAPQSCTPNAARFVGANEQFRFYEVKCSEGFGFVAQTDPQGAPIDARDCGQPQLVPGGCTLTDTATAQAAASEQRAALLAQSGVTCTIQQEAIRAVENRPDGSPGRELYELECAEQPLGLVGFFPVDAQAGEVEAYDCFSMDARGVECQFVTRDAINAVLTSMVTASQRNCNVVEYRVFARMANLSGDVAEIKCDDGRGWIGEFPDDRQAAGQLLPCAAAARQGDECVL